jgi:hypothetical protein
MARLVLEYVLEGHRRGYNFTTPTHHFSDEELKLIWRRAMPRGQGWGAPEYAGARSLKAFQVAPSLVAISDVTVTDMRDEGGRGGIRRAVIDVVSVGQYRGYLEERLAMLPGDLQARLARQPTCAQRVRIVQRSLSWFWRDPQLVLAHPFGDTAHWQFIEALVIKLALAPVGPMKRWGSVISFTTLALDYRDEGQIVALPAARLEAVAGKASVIRV